MDTNYRTTSAESDFSELCNKDIKETIKKSGVPQWRVALFLGVSENTLIRWLRLPLSDFNRMRIMDAVRQLTRDRG